MESIVLDRVNKEMVWELEKSKLNLSHLWVLELFYNNKSIDVPALDDLSRTSAYNTLQRKGYIMVDQITEDGRILYELIVSLNTDGEAGLQATVKRLSKQKDPEKDVEIDNFEEWWLAYPTTDRVTDDNGAVVHKETRAIRIGKDYCRTKYDAIIADGVKHEDLVAALKYEVTLRKKQSERGENKMTFMNNSKSYLFQRSYEAFIELAKEKQPTVDDDKFNV